MMGGMGSPASFRTSYPMSIPVRSASSKGPIGYPRSWTIVASTSRISASPFETIQAASLPKGASTLLTTNPRTSFRT